MANAVEELRAQAEASWANLTRQLEGMEPHLERSDAPGEWTTREVLSHLLFPPGDGPVEHVRRFSEAGLPEIEIAPGDTYLDAPRRGMTLRQLLGALDAQRQDVLGFLDTLPGEALERRKARIPLFKEFMGTDEIPLGTYVGAMFDFHWGDHTEQLAKIRKAVGLAEV